MDAKAPLVIVGELVTVFQHGIDGIEINGTPISDKVWAHFGNGEESELCGIKFTSYGKMRVTIEIVKEQDGG